ncbi:YdbH domain-containing protein [Lentisphaerota bacterium ZTH]|nr:YdbH domain-containing protein [Lentisphaerota bacterium ZTH]
MEKTKDRKAYFRIKAILLFLVFLALALAWAFYKLPDYVQDRVLPQIAKSYGFPNLHAKMRRIGMSGVDVGRLNFANGAIAVDSVRVDYRLLPLLTRNTMHIKRMTLSGIKVNCIVKDNKIELENFDFQKLKKHLAARKKTTPDKASKYKVAIDEVVFDGLLNLRKGNDCYTAHFSAIIKPDSDFKKIDIKLTSGIGSAKTEANALLDLKKCAAQIQVNQYANLKEVEGLLRLKKGIELSGSLRAALKSSFTWKPFALRFVELNVKVPGFSFIKGGEKVAADKMIFKALGRKGKVNFMTGNLHFTGKAEAEIKQISGGMNIQTDRLNISCNVPVLVKTLGNLNLKAGSPLQAQCDLNGEYKSGAWNAAADLSIQPFNAVLPFGQLSLSKTVFALKTGADDLKSLPLVSVKACVGAINLAHKLMDVKVPESKLQAVINGRHVKGLASFENGVIDCSKFKLKVDGVSLKCPFAYPDRMPTAAIDCKKITWDNLLLGRLSGKINTGLPVSTYSAIVAVAPFAGMKISLSGAVKTGAASGFELKAVLPKYRITTLSGLAGKFEMLRNMTFSAMCEGTALFRKSGEKIYSTGNFKLSQGNWSSKDNDMRLEGVSLSLQLADLLKLRSLPNQKLKFDRFEAGKMLVTAGEVDFQIESPKSYLLEKSSFGLCGGHIYTHAMRIKTGRHNYRAIVYCDGIVLSQLIESLGLSRAVGRGKVLGRIPVRLSKQGITFEKGYLYSVPGRGNNLKLLDTEALMKNVPENTREFTQLDIAGEALKDFDYQWVKLYLNTADGELKIKMKLDGKPANALPFTYDNKRKMFVRIKGKGAKFQGIRLDVNTSIPLNRLMHISSKFKKLTGGVPRK